MTVYQCDTCGEQMPGGAAGSSFLVKGSSGRTDHFCSQACLRAFVNRIPHTDIVTPRAIIGAICGATLILHLVIALIVTHP